MKFISGFLFILAISCTLNAFDSGWMLDPNVSGTKWTLLEIGIGILCLILSLVIYVVAVAHEDEDY